MSNARNVKHKYYKTQTQVLKQYDSKASEAHIALGSGEEAQQAAEDAVATFYPFSQFYDIGSGSCRCALIGVPCRLSMLSTFSTFANVLS